MSAPAPLPAIALPRHASLNLDDRAGDRIDCVAGVLWITQHGDPRDIVLPAGASFRLDRDGRSIVFALADARLAVAHRRPAARWKLRLTHALVAWRARLLRPAGARSYA